MDALSIVITLLGLEPSNGSRCGSSARLRNKAKVFPVTLSSKSSKSIIPWADIAAIALILFLLLDFVFLWKATLQLNIRIAS